MKSTLLFLALSAAALQAQAPEPTFTTTLNTNIEAPAINPSTAPVEQTIGYATLGVGPLPLPLPTFGLGLRTQTNHHGFDLSLQAATLVEITQLKASALYQHYFKPNLASQFYVGGGIGTSVLFFDDTFFLLSPELVFGKQYQNEAQDTRFFQAQISFPTLNLTRHYHYHDDLLLFPAVVLTYGIGF
jgi:hypothetical protein